MGNSSSRKLSLRSLGWLTGVNLLVAVMGVLQTIVIARIFGASRSVEVFFAATTFQMFLLKLSNSGQIGDLFVPLFHEIQADHGKVAGRQAFSVMTNIMVLATLGIASVGFLLADPLSGFLVPGFEPDDVRRCAQAFRVIAPLCVVQVISGMFSNLLRAEHHYGVQEGLNLLSRTLSVVLLLALGYTLGFWALVLALWIAGVVQLSGQVYFAYLRGYRHHFAIRTAEFSPGEVLWKLPYTAWSILSSQFLLLALTGGLSGLPEGTYAIFSYAKRIHAKFQGLVLQPVSILFFNRFSQEKAEGKVEITNYARHGLSLSVAIVAICTVGVICGGDYLMLGLWRGEKFSIGQIRETHHVLIAFTVLLLSNAQYLISRRTNMVLKAVGRQLIASSVAVTIAALSCYALIPAFGLWGAVAGQAISIVGMTIVSVVITWIINRDLVATIPLRSCVCWTASGAIAVMITNFLREFSGIGYDESHWKLILAAVIFGSFASIVCFVFSWIFRNPDALDLMERSVRLVSSKRSQTDPS